MADPEQWWTVTQDGETLAKLPNEIQAMNWLHNRQSSSIDWAIRNEGYDIVLIRDGKKVWSYRDRVLGERIAKAVAGEIAPEEAADLFESSVQQAFTRVYGYPQDVSVIGRSIRSSFSEEGKKLAWTEPDPNVVLVLTEYAWVPDLWESVEDHDRWEEAAKLLRSMGWPNAGVDSINPAVQVVYWRPNKPFDSKKSRG